MNVNAWPLLWFVVVAALIPVLLGLLKRTPMARLAQAGPVRTVAALPLSTNQRILTVEVGHGDGRRWLVLGVTANTITTLHEMAPTAPPVGDAGAATVTPFANLLDRFRGGSGAPRA